MPLEIGGLMNAKLERLRASRLEAMKEFPAGNGELVFTSVMEPRRIDERGHHVFGHSEPRWVPKSRAHAFEWMANPAFLKAHQLSGCTSDHPCQACQEWKAKEAKLGK
jgi:hypothetical protein